jgi:hypothetical protein
MVGTYCPGHQETPGSAAPHCARHGQGARLGSPTEQSIAHAPLALAPLCLDTLGPTAPTLSPCPVALGDRPPAARARAPPRRLVGDPPPVAQRHASGGCHLPGRAARVALRGPWDAQEGRRAPLGAPCPPGAGGGSGRRLPDAGTVAPGLHTRRRRRCRVSDAARVHAGARPAAVGAGPARARSVPGADGRGARRPSAPRAARAGRPPPGAPGLPCLRGCALSSGPRCRTPRVLARPAAAETGAAGATVSWPPETGAACPTPATRVGLCAPLPGRARATHGRTRASHGGPLRTRSRPHSSWVRTRRSTCLGCFLMNWLRGSAAQELHVVATEEGNSSIREWWGQKNAEDSGTQPGTQLTGCEF